MPTDSTTIVVDDSELAAPVAGSTIAYQASARPGGGGELTATGDAPTPGFVFFFRELPRQEAQGTVAANRFELRMRRPTGITIQVVTPFAVTEPFLSLLPGGSVAVTDALGTYTITITDTASPSSY